MELKDLTGKTIGLAVSGGLDSCTITRWLADKGVRVICFTADLGQPDETDFEDVKNRMLACGAAEAHVIAAKKEIGEAGLEVIQAQAMYEGGYWNTTGIARHITVKAILPYLRIKGIKYFGHGATGRGNDQVRFQLVMNMLAPEIEVFAPWRCPEFLLEFGGRKEMIEYCNSKGLPIKATLAKPYSTDANMLGLTHEAGQLELLTTPAMLVEPEMGVWPQNAHVDSEKVELVFVAGRPTIIGSSITDEITKQNTKDCSNIILAANRIAGRHGVGIGLHTVENRFVGIKSRGVYEAPGMELLGKCYQFLLQQVLDRRAMKMFNYISAQLAEQIYQGYYYDTASQMMKAALQKVTQLVTGKIVVRLYKGNVLFESSSDVERSLYSDTRSSMEKGGEFNHEDSEGFLGVLGVSAKALAAAGQIKG